LPASCQPQSWSAAAPFSLLTTLLGLEADATRQCLRVRPARTRLWKRLQVAGLHFAGHRLDFEVDDDRVRVGALPAGIQLMH
jgi:glycogen debranching enzyme